MAKILLKLYQSDKISPNLVTLRNIYQQSKSFEPLAQKILVPPSF